MTRSLPKQMTGIAARTRSAARTARSHASAFLRGPAQKWSTRAVQRSHSILRASTELSGIAVVILTAAAVYIAFQANELVTNQISIMEEDLLPLIEVTMEWSDEQGIPRVVVVSERGRMYDPNVEGRILAELRTAGSSPASSDGSILSPTGVIGRGLTGNFSGGANNPFPTITSRGVAIANLGLEDWLNCHPGVHVVPPVFSTDGSSTEFTLTVQILAAVTYVDENGRERVEFFRGYGIPGRLDTIGFIPVSDRAFSEAWAASGRIPFVRDVDLPGVMTAVLEAAEIEAELRQAMSDAWSTYVISAENTGQLCRTATA